MAAPLERMMRLLDRLAEAQAARRAAVDRFTAALENHRKNPGSDEAWLEFVVANAEVRGAGEVVSALGAELAPLRWAAPG